MDKKDKERLISEYSERYKLYGYSPKTLGWDKGKQDVRFSILTAPFQVNGKKVLDIGCGFGDLNNYLRKEEYMYSYCGIDIVDQLLSEAKKNHPQHTFILGNFLEYEFEETFDFAIASGIFNHKFEGDMNNYEFIEKCIKKALGLVKEGIAFDFLSDKVDYTYELSFYSSPSVILDIAYQFSRNIILRNDYMPFEFSLFVFKDDSFDTYDTMFRKYKNKGMNI